jgi:hypothetical protein
LEVWPTITFHDEARKEFSNKFFMKIFILGPVKSRSNAIISFLIEIAPLWKLGFLDEAMLQANRFRVDKKEQFIRLVNMYR